MFEDYATPDGTARYAARFARHQANGFFRPAQELTVSSLGLGSYLGAMDDAADRGYEEAVMAAVRGGINFLDTSLNYRNQRSELAIGAALKHLIQPGEFAREEIVVATKAGFLVPNAIPWSALAPGDVAGGIHALAPAFLDDQLERSRENLGLATIDIFYLHNPETQLQYLERNEFLARMRRAFEKCEEAAADGRIRYYGTATWDGYRSPGLLSLKHLAQLARELGGEAHRFRFIQLPYNLAMTEAFSRNSYEGKSVLEEALELGITVVASASLLQARLVDHLPDQVRAILAGFDTDAQRSIQFTRSAPGVTVALVGMGRTAHVAENLALACRPPVPVADYVKLLRG
jgi:aryl-alcohol dehydrogenase-like predicted oxidoreductase